MSIPFLSRRRSVTTRLAVPAVEPAHRTESGFDAAACRFRIRCTCGAEFDTRYIDEALEWRELHLDLAPLADQLAG